jgi:hypothetical protein
LLEAGLFDQLFCAQSRVSHGWGSVRTSCTLGRYSSEIRTGCANERPSGSVRGGHQAIGVPTAFANLPQTRICRYILVID